MQIDSVALPSGGPPRRLRHLFVGDSGLRAGWRVALFYALFFALGFGTVFIPHIVAPATFQPNAFTATFVLVQEVIFLIEQETRIGGEDVRRPDTVLLRPLPGRETVKTCAILPRRCRA